MAASVTAHTVVSRRWEILDIGRKFVLMLIVVFFMPGTASQVVVLMVVACAVFAVLRTFKPYVLSHDDALAAAAQALIVLILLVVLCIKLEVTADDGWGDSGVDVALCTLVSAVPVLALLFGLQFQLTKRYRNLAKVAAVDLAKAEADIDKMKKQLAAAQDLVDRVMNEGGSLLASYAISYDSLKFDKKIGEGSFGAVWRGSMHDGETVAIKRMRVGRVTPGALRKFKEEVLASGSSNVF